ncbi:MAG: hypothetical protein JXR26_04275 [Balneolaceae bacterium]|nr:hypothetical protein [Balneolaceae bacterium]
MKRDNFMKLVATGAITPFITSTAADKNGNAPKRSTGQMVRSATLTRFW